MKRIISVRGRRWLHAVQALLLLAGLVIGLGDARTAQAGQIYPCGNERLGFGVVSGIQHYNVAPLRAGWYVNWGATAATAHPAGMDFAQIIRTNSTGYWTNGDTIADIVARNPGALWLIGNEPDSPVQDPTLPEAYATIYHNAYTEIKRLDPAAQVAIGGMVGATPVRMKWLDRAWAEYRRLYGADMPVDIWNVHAFVLREVRPGHGKECAPVGSTDTGTWGALIPPGVEDNCGQWIKTDELDRHDLFQQQIVRFRTWMRDHGQQNKELVVSEYGILFPEELGYPYSRVKDYMLWTFNYFSTARDTAIGYPGDDYHLVQRWAWYSLDDNNFGWGTTRSALMTSYDPSKPTVVPQLTQLGNDFVQYASAKAAACTTYVDLLPVRLTATPAGTIPYGATTTLGLTVEVQNRGTAPSPASQVRVYDGDPDAGGALIATAPLSSVPARYQGAVTVTANWTVAATGGHTLVAVVDPGNQIAESREGNNRLAVPLSFGTVNLVVTPASWRLDAGPLRPAEATQMTLLPGTVALNQVEPPSAGLSIAPIGYTLTWYDGDAPNAHQIAAETVAAPAVFGSTYTPPTQPWAPVLTDAHRLRFTATLANGAPETTLADNTAQVSVPASQPDLVLAQIRKENSGPGLAASGTFTVHLQVRIANLGTLAPPADLAVSFHAGTTTADPEIGRVALEAGGNWTTPLAWTNPSTGAHPFLAFVDPDNLIAESREDNNALSGTVFADPKNVYLPIMRR